MDMKLLFFSILVVQILFVFLPAETAHNQELEEAFAQFANILEKHDLESLKSVMDAMNEDAAIWNKLKSICRTHGSAEYQDACQYLQAHHTLIEQRLEEAARHKVIKNEQIDIGSAEKNTGTGFWTNLFLCGGTRMKKNKQICENLKKQDSNDRMSGGKRINYEQKILFQIARIAQSMKKRVERNLEAKTGLKIGQLVEYIETICKAEIQDEQLVANCEYFENAKKIMNM